ncbi:hypothetical protein [Streptomyces sp. RPT161]|uniref:hypothetical protein n=1 Tax=Streptomyces sp. RPT161 TaxID=3015993 RepID=UPI0022B89C77|nr:hypothetical protein [Streptomyces sp. RPT161]
MRLFRPVVFGLSGLALAMAVPTGAAVAANGTFSWLGPHSQAHFLQNPPDNKCYDMGQEARGARNGLRQPLVTYPRKRCKGTPTHLRPGQSSPSGAHFSSVIFNPR